MISIAQIIGVDPGLVHTGVVGMTFRARNHTIDIHHTYATGTDVDLVAKWVKDSLEPYPKVYVEQYRTRQNLNQDKRMIQLEQDLRRALPGATFLNNMGVKRVVTEDLMKILRMWQWKTATHHQDLRSAARIALLGMMKDDVTNMLLADVVRDHLDGAPWVISHV